MLRGQSSIEFMQAAAVSLLFFTVCMGIYFMAQSELADVSRAADARRICYEIASQISAIASAGEGASAPLLQPQKATNEEYEIFVTGNTGAVSVNFKDDGNEERGASCFVGHRDILNATGAANFKIKGDETVSYLGGVVRIG